MHILTSSHARSLTECWFFYVLLDATSFHIHSLSRWLSRSSAKEALLTPDAAEQARQDKAREEERLRVEAQLATGTPVRSCETLRSRASRVDVPGDGPCRKVIACTNEPVEEPVHNHT